MNQNKVIGLTGSIATGKSQVSNYLRDKGIKVVDAELFIVLNKVVFHQEVCMYFMMK